MIKNLHFHLRPAIAMIELIFAIVVMGIVMMSAPMLLSTSSNSAIVVIQQEAIAEAATQANIIIGYPWDENNITNREFPVLNTTNGDFFLRATIITFSKPRRSGTSPFSPRLFVSSSGNQYNASPIGQEGGDRDDIDDFNGVNRLVDVEAAGAFDYLEHATVRLTNTVTYIADTLPGLDTYQNPGIVLPANELPFALNLNPMPPNQTTNIKHIQVTLTSDSPAAELSKNITLHAFSCNIGSYKLEER